MDAQPDLALFFGVDFFAVAGGRLRCARATRHGDGSGAHPEADFHVYGAPDCHIQPQRHGGLDSVAPSDQHARAGRHLHTNANSYAH